MIGITINDTNYDVTENITVFQACHQLGINIPSLCYDERLTPEAKCKLCVVEVEGKEDLITSCTLKVENGMRLQTHSDRVISARREVLNKFLVNHPQDCEDCTRTNECKLKVYTAEYGAVYSETEGDKIRYPIDESNPFYDIDPNKCILCNKCIRVCSELQVRGALEINEKGHIARKTILTDKNSPSVECECCGNCISVCPTGALRPKRYKEEFAVMHDFADIEVTKSESQESRNVRTTCTYCGVGCQLELVVKNEQVVDVKPVNIPPNNGLLCVKGRFGFRFIKHHDRLKNPLIKKSGEFVEASWDEAYDLIIGKAKQLKEKYGGDVFGGISSARCTNEENYLFQKLIRGVFGTNSVDHCARL
jgi:NADH-quinone oxidoreductase subunit G